MPAMSSSDSKTREGPGAGTSKSRQLKIDKSGLYDLMQVKRLLDDEVISVCSASLFFSFCLLGCFI